MCNSVVCMLHVVYTCKCMHILHVHVHVHVYPSINRMALPSEWIPKNV